MKNNNSLELESLRKDKKRLDWILENPYTFYMNWMYSTYMPKDNTQEGRVSIDKAMSTLGVC